VVRFGTNFARSGLNSESRAGACASKEEILNHATTKRALDGLPSAEKRIIKSEVRRFMAREYRLDREDVQQEATRLMLEAKQRGYNATRLYVRHELIKFGEAKDRAEQFPLPRSGNYDGDGLVDLSPADRRIRNDNNPDDGFEFEPGALGWYSSGSCVPRPDRWLPYKLPIYRPVWLSEIVWAGMDLRTQPRGTARLVFPSAQKVKTHGLPPFWSPDAMSFKGNDPAVMIWLRYVFGISYEDIGSSFGISADAARKRISYLIANKTDTPLVAGYKPKPPKPPSEKFKAQDAADWRWDAIVARHDCAPGLLVQTGGRLIKGGKVTLEQFFNYPLGLRCQTQLHLSNLPLADGCSVWNRFGTLPYVGGTKREVRLERPRVGPCLELPGKYFLGGQPGRQPVKPRAQTSGNVFRAPKPAKGRPGRYICALQCPARRW